ncbi:hypothetical protein [Sphingobacterium composti Ten et al. 2007 non Yoo et al. 2007]|uniref:hypothetical protein n=1 Tax=Sphingobacterium composti TaxID=363260 RepID=UPI00135A9E8B|nr:hypothetical protein [Sphingobacterium composti Ten et al. 2007 non Yoo et al. 2007]
MNRVIAFISRYTKLSEQAIDYLYIHGRIKKYRKGSIFILQQDTNNLSCLLLDGLAGCSIMNHKYDLALTKVITPFNYFVGSKHIYSNKGSRENIEFLKDSEGFIINRINVQHAIRSFPEFSLIYHILKERNIAMCSHFIHLHKIKYVDRLSFLYHHFPEVKNQLTIQQLCSLLGYTNSKQYYFALEKYYQGQGF